MNLIFFLIEKAGIFCLYNGFLFTVNYCNILAFGGGCLPVFAKEDDTILTSPTRSVQGEIMCRSPAETWVNF